MKIVFVALILSISTLFAVACEQESSSKESTSSTAASADTVRSDTVSADSKHAPAQVAPGSHEDWCGEHQVPESLCTRCNPKLIAAFKATNDWCKEHGLPESQCLICNPELKIERPPQRKGQ